MYLIDTHAHLNDEKFHSDLDEVISRANAQDVKRIIVCGYDMVSSLKAIELSAKYECVYATIGVHPHDAKTFDSITYDEIKSLASCGKVVAIGEMGLDFHYNLSVREKQIEAFKSQIDLAAECLLPIVIHSRTADEETMQVLTAKKDKISKGVFHCFSSDEEYAKKVLDMGFYLGIDGPVTYKSAAKLKKVVEMCPLDRILLETDCPYLSPQAFRGKRNEPSYLSLIAKQVAEIKNMDIEEIADITTKNANALFFSSVLS